MKIKLFYSCLIFIGFFLNSCDPNGVNNNLGNYWERSTVALMNLKGKVKTITINSGSITSFNESGFITSVVNNMDSSIYIYNANGQLAKIVSKSPNGNSPLISTITYEYNNPGKYIVQSTSEIFLYMLTPNLSSTTTVSSMYPEGNYTKVEYIFKNSTTMNIVTINVLFSTISKDSSTVQYNGYYPSGWSIKGDFAKDITYASNGMYKTYTVGYKGTSTTNTNVYTFKTNDNYLMPETHQETFADTSTPSNNFSYPYTYTYNDKNDPLEVSGEGGSTQYINFEYDTQGNWISKTKQFKSKGATTWTTVEQTVRTITYW